MTAREDAICKSLERSITEASFGGYKYVASIVNLSDSFEKCISLNPVIKDKVQKELTSTSRESHDIHMLAMLKAFCIAAKHENSETLIQAGRIERLKALDILAGVALHSFKASELALYVPEELDAPHYLMEINKLGLKNMGTLAALQP